MKNEDETRITVRFPRELIDELKTFLKHDDRSLNAEIVQAVREFVATKRKERKAHDEASL